jgi:hypothetical protein
MVPFHGILESPSTKFFDAFRSLLLSLLCRRFFKSLVARWKAALQPDGYQVGLWKRICAHLIVG